MRRRIRRKWSEQPAPRRWKDTLDEWERPRIIQDFYEGFAAGAWSRTFGDFLDSRTGVEDPITRAFSSLAFTVTTQSLLAFSEWIQGNASGREGVERVLYDTIPAWLQGTVLDAALREQGITNSVGRGFIKTALSTSYLAAADAVIDLFND